MSNTSLLKEQDNQTQKLQPVQGILDVLDNCGFVRGSGYLADADDAYVSMALIRKHGLRRGDLIVGAVGTPKDSKQNGNGRRQRQQFAPLERLDSVNGAPPAAAQQRPKFGDLVPLYPTERLRLETEPGNLTTRTIDLVMPIGKGQRALIVAPPKAGKTVVLQHIAAAIGKNHPDCHLMVVLVGERPEEVTDMRRTVPGEVIASTFDRPAADHTALAELAIERAKRLVEQGQDVVVLLDSLTRLGRAYNVTAPSSGRTLSGGIDSAALFPPKYLLGAARNIEDGGSLTIIATTLVETGSLGDTLIYEEYKGTGNAELKLDRTLASRRVFPAVDIEASGTRREEWLLSPDELAVTHRLRRALASPAARDGRDGRQGIDQLLESLRKTRTNIEFLSQLQRPAAAA
jgi:transcription termination factor Rho